MLSFGTFDACEYRRINNLVRDAWQVGTARKLSDAVVAAGFMKRFLRTFAREIYLYFT